jgi:hypothetical protein
MHLTDQIGKIEAAGQAVPASFYGRLAELMHLADSPTTQQDRMVMYRSLSVP